MSRKHKHNTKFVDRRQQQQQNGSFESDKQQAIEWCNEWMNYHLNWSDYLATNHRRRESDEQFVYATRADDTAKALARMNPHQFNNWLFMLETTGYAYPENRQ